jgi:hypothetical protein
MYPVSVITHMLNILDTFNMGITDQLYTSYEWQQDKQWQIENSTLKEKFTLELLWTIHLLIHNIIHKTNNNIRPNLNLWN